MNHRRRRRHHAWRLALVALVTACADAADPMGSELPVAVAVTLDVAAGGPAEAYDETDAIAVVVRTSQSVVFDETEPFDPATGETRVRVRLDRELAGTTILVEATLLASTRPIFRGSTSVTLAESGPTELNLPLVAVIADIALADPVAAFTAIGETLPLSAAAVFATADTIPGVVITWRSLDPAVVTVQGTTARSIAEGTARLEASAGGVTGQTTATVAAQVTRVTVSPPTATVSVGQSQTFTAQAFDRNANLLTRTFDWSSSNPPIATVTAAGVATGVSAGATSIVAATGGVQGAATLTVTDVPLAPANLAGTILNETTRTYRLTWEDRSTNEEYFAVERRIEAGPYEEIARTAANATEFEAIAPFGMIQFRVLACNAEGCSPPSNVVSLEFAGGPPVATTLAPPDIGVMSGRVEGASPYTVRFQYGFDPSDFEDNSECPCYEETAAQMGVGIQTFSVPVDLWYTEEPLFYRIVAENEFGESIGVLRSDTIPTVDTSSSTDEYFIGDDVVLSAEIFTPGSTANPLAGVTFEVQGVNPPYNTVLSDGTAITSTVGSGRIHVYGRTWNVPDDFDTVPGFASVEVIVTFRSGATAYAPSLFMSLSSSEGLNDGTGLRKPAGNVGRVIR